MSLKIFILNSSLELPIFILLIPNSLITDSTCQILTILICHYIAIKVPRLDKIVVWKFVLY